MKPRDLRLLVMHVSTRCDQTCAHCSIWKMNGKGARELGVEERLAIIREARLLGAQAILFTGGEPLLCDHLETLARTADRLGLSVQIATNGLGLARSVSWLGEVVAEIYISLEGPLAVHDGVRGAGMFSRLKGSIEEIRALPRRARLVGRSTISAQNAGILDETVRAARALGLDAVSFLPIDVTSDAFGGDPGARARLRPSPADVIALRQAISRLSASGELGAFVIEDAGKLRRIADAFLLEPSSRMAPACNAPEWSSVVEADGAVRPCFFQPAVPFDRTASLGALRESKEYAAALLGLGEGDPICASCVCPKLRAQGTAALRGLVGAALVRAMPRFLHRPGSAA